MQARPHKTYRRPRADHSGQSLFRFDRIETGLWILDLTRFLDANRSPLRLKTLWKSDVRTRPLRWHYVCLARTPQ
jgi:hypothetical protein